MDVRIRRLEIPLRVGFDQASYSRRTSASLVVEATLDGHTGLGEGCPRTYVTGETLDEAVACARRLAKRVAPFATTVASLREFIGQHRAEIDATPAAWCAVECAVLDALARRNGVTVETLLEIPTHRSSFTYSAIVPSMDPKRTWVLVRRWIEMGARDFKMKVGVVDADDPARMAAFRDAVESAASSRLRLDANNAWAGDVDRALEALESLGAGYIAVEEPVAPRRFDDLERIAAGRGVAIVLDESFTRPADALALAGRRNEWIVNIKVSKAGGLLRSLTLIDAARDVGAPIIIGAHVGETSIATRAGLVAARHAGDALWAMEGAAGTMLLDHDPVVPELRFGANLVLDLGRSALGPIGSGLSSAWSDV